MMEERSCKTCSGPVSASSRTGNCRACALVAINADPRVREKIAEANRAKARQPAFRARLKVQIAMAGVEARKNPVFLKLIRDNCRQNLVAAWTPEARAKWCAGRSAAGKKISATKLAWCPPDRLDEYRHLTRKRGLLAADARKIIMDSLTPFERQMQAVRNGAGITIVRPIPRRVEPPYTLGGVSAL